MRIVTNEGSSLRGINTPIVRTMRRTARDLGVVDLLLKHQRLVLCDRPADAYDLVEEVLLVLGVSNNELLGESPKEGLKMAIYYILNDADKPVPVENVTLWARLLQNMPVGQRRVASNFVGDVRVSTVFLGIDHNFSLSGDPILWETMIFGGPEDGFQRRYTSKADAIVGHAEAMKLVSTPDAKE